MLPAAPAHSGLVGGARHENEEVVHDDDDDDGVEGGFPVRSAITTPGVRRTGGMKMFHTNMQAHVLVTHTQREEEGEEGQG